MSRYTLRADMKEVDELISGIVHRSVQAAFRAIRVLPGDRYFSEDRGVEFTLAEAMGYLERGLGIIVQRPTYTITVTKVWKSRRKPQPKTRARKARCDDRSADAECRDDDPKRV